jgi:hypothetical protein
MFIGGGGGGGGFPVTGPGGGGETGPVGAIMGGGLTGIIGAIEGGAGGCGLLPLTPTEPGPHPAAARRNTATDLHNRTRAMLHLLLQTTLIARHAGSAKKRCQRKPTFSRPKRSTRQHPAARAMPFRPCSCHCLTCGIGGTDTGFSHVGTETARHVSGPPAGVYGFYSGSISLADARRAGGVRHLFRVGRDGGGRVRVRVRARVRVRVRVGRAAGGTRRAAEIRTPNTLASHELELELALEHAHEIRAPYRGRDRGVRPTRSVWAGLSWKLSSGTGRLGSYSQA